MKKSFDALIVGAGPAGSSTAIHLAQAGWSVALIEKQIYPRRKVCGECLAASNLPILDALGIGSEFIANAGPELRHIALMRNECNITAELPASPNSYPWGRALGREVLDTLLLERARAVGTEVLQPWSVQKVNNNNGVHSCTVLETISKKISILKAPVIILAHGSWEPLPADREVQRLARKGSDLLAFKANFIETTLNPGLLPILLFNGGYGGMVLADDGITTLACCVRVDRLEILRRASPGKSAGEVIETMLKHECLGVKVALHGSRRQGGWIASGPLSPGVRLQRNETIFRIGNAAGEAHPIIGEGMSMALQSSWMLCEKLLKAQQTNNGTFNTKWQNSVQEEYIAQWRREFLPRIRIASAFANLAMRPASSAILMKLLERWPSLITQGAIMAGKVSCSVRAINIRSNSTRVFGA